MRILAYLELYAHKNKSGGEIYIHNLLKNIEGNVSVITDGESEGINYDGIKVFESNEPNKIQYIDNCDIVISQLKYSLKALKYGLLKGKKCILIVHSYLKELDQLIEDERVIKIFNSNYVFKDCKKIKGKHFIIEPFVDFPLYNKYFDKDLECREYIGMVNPSFSKGGDVFYELCKYFKDRKFIVVEGGYLKETQPLQKFRDLPNVLVLKNTHRMIEEFYSRTRIVIIPSRLETYGMVAVEAMSMGIPVIVNEDTGLKENIGKIGLYARTPIKQCNKTDLKSYIKKIELLDDKSTYILWVNYFINRSYEKYINNQGNVEQFLACLSRTDSRTEQKL